MFVLYAYYYKTILQVKKHIVKKRLLNSTLVSSHMEVKAIKTHNQFKQESSYNLYL